MRTRKMIVVWERDASKDHEKDGIKYYGNRVLWEDGMPVTVGIEQLCQSGMKTIIGKEAAGDRHKILMETTVVPADAPRDKKSDGVRRRRLYIQQEGEAARLFFHNGEPTEIVFNKDDDPRALDFFAVNDLAPGQQIWFDISAQTMKEESHAGNPIGYNAG